MDELDEKYGHYADRARVRHVSLEVRIPKRSVQVIDMSTWTDLTVDVIEDLHLDPENIRLDFDSSSIPEADIMHDLFTNEKAMSLVDGIVRVGYLTHEVPIVVKRAGKLIVVEGNRRVAALKAIQNPDLAPGHSARITRLIESVGSRPAPRKISVKQAPNQDDANQLIAALHTGNQRLPWAPQRQAAFFQAQLDNGKTAEELIAQYPTIDVKKFIVRSKILNLFRTVDYKDSGLKDFVQSRKFPVSTLARMYDYDRFLELAEIEVDEDRGLVVLKARPRYFGKLAEKIISGIKSKDLNTRSLNTTSSDKYLTLMDELRELRDRDELEPDDEPVEEHAEAPATAPVPSSSAASAPEPAPQSTSTSPNSKPRAKSTSAAPPGAASATAPVTPKAPKKNRNFLKTEVLVVPVGFPPPIHMVFKELTEINITRFPNATLDLIRSFLEKSIKAYAEDQSTDIRQALQVGGFIQLSHCLDWLNKEIQAGNMATAFRQPINKIRSGKLGEYILTQDHLNAINHNHHVFATAEEVRSAWAMIEGLLKAILKP